jgi:hypothetical protein
VNSNLQKHYEEIIPTRLKTTIQNKIAAPIFNARELLRKSGLSRSTWRREIMAKNILNNPAIIAPISAKTTKLHTASVSRPAKRNKIQTYESNHNGIPIKLKPSATVEILDPKVLDFSINAPEILFVRIPFFNNFLSQSKS